jgi:hydrogenase small subunit
VTPRPTLYEKLRCQGVSRRGFLKFCGRVSSLMALPVGGTEAIADALSTKLRPSVIWLFRARMHGLQ